MTHVFEFREPSWYTTEMFALLERYGASFCAHDMPGLDRARGSPSGRSPMSDSMAERQILGPLHAMRCCSSWADWIVAQARAGRAGLGLFQQRSRSSRHP